MTARTLDRNGRSLKTGVVLIVFILAGLQGCSPATQFSVMRGYVKKQFSGRDLNGQPIVLMPLITGQGIERGEDYSPSVLINEVNKNRPDLRLQRPEKFLERYENRYGGDALDSLALHFFKNAMVALQTNERIWKEVGAGYVMVLKLTFGLKTKSLDDRTVRQMRIEGELWDCDSSEVVWRAIVDSRSKGTVKSDKEILLKAVVKLFGAMPQVLEGYGKGRW